MSTPAVENYEAIRRRQEELKAEQDLALTGSTLPVEKPEPAYVDYESFCGFSYDNTFSEEKLQAALKAAYQFGSRP